MTTTVERPLRDAADGQARGPRTAELFVALVNCTDEAQRRLLRDEVVTLNLDVADGIASRYARRGVPSDDLVQVARLALVRVAQTFEPDRDCDFLAYAVPSIRGAVKRYFRDAGWTVRPPRRVQEAQLAMNAARPTLVQSLGREPTVAEVSVATGMEAETVIEALAVDSCYSPDSLDRPLEVDGLGASLGSTLGALEPGFALCEQRAALEPAIQRLSERDRKVLQLRFVEGLTQAEVGREIGVSQMQISRILARILAGLRQQLTEETTSSSAPERRHGGLPGPHRGR
jgi:RNA polymerase sigma-B factor